MSVGHWGGGDVWRHMACAWLRTCAFGYEGAGVWQIPGKELGEVERN